MSDITNWTTLLVTMSVPLIALCRKQWMSDEQVTVIALAIYAVCFFSGRALDGALAWPPAQSLAVEFAALLVGQQILHGLLRKTYPMKWLEQQ